MQRGGTLQVAEVIHSEAIRLTILPLKGFIDTNLFGFIESGRRCRRWLREFTEELGEIRRVIGEMRRFLFGLE